MFARTGIAANETRQSGNGVFAADAVRVHRSGWHADRTDGRHVAAVAIGRRHAGRDGHTVRELLMKTAILRTYCVRHGQWQLEGSAEDRNWKWKWRVTSR